MKKQKTYYKVVTSDLRSARASNWSYNRTWAVQYKIDEFVKPEQEGSLLMVFENLNDALEFCIFGELIYECEVTDPRPLKFLSCSVTTIKDFWFGDKETKRSIQERSPTGTIGVTSVKLTKLTKAK